MWESWRGEGAARGIEARGVKEGRLECITDSSFRKAARWRRWRRFFVVYHLALPLPSALPWHIATRSPSKRALRSAVRAETGRWTERDFDDGGKRLQAHCLRQGVVQSASEVAREVWETLVLRRPRAGRARAACRKRLVPWRSGGKTKEALILYRRAYFNRKTRLLTLSKRTTTTSTV